ncbi:HAD family hydrolase [Lachnobacterium bovis]|uniref:Putative hydrolase of the HAD superfamily n=1 Tax=Lachnobacterium bovis TaxID=140626 RepID=A0A1H9SAI2_9FIRM|nr:HAD family hydrolase [Lachnobacterium bovis]SER81961.1 putative hydrolase of the HAD superfamily [Lachnobacterium bovis]
MIKTVVLDIDNTIYSFKECDIIAAKKIADYMKINFDMDEGVVLTALEDLKKIQKRRVGLDVGAIHSRVIRYQMLLEKYNLPIFPHTSIMTKIYWECMLDNMKLEKNLAECIDFLKKKNIKIGICTDMTALIQHEKIQKLGLSNKIDFMVSSEESGAEKPSKKMFDLVMYKAKVKPEECLFIGDSISKDVKGPIDYGMYALWYSKYTRDKEMNSTFFKDNKLEVVDYRSLIKGDCGLFESAIEIDKVLNNKDAIAKIINNKIECNEKHDKHMSKNIIFEIKKF